MTSLLPKVLIVDDDPVVAEAVRAALVATGEFEVVVASDAPTALACIEAAPPALLLLDVRMPGLDGFDLLSNLRGRPETRLLSVVVVSGPGRDDDRARALEAGADDYITKPVALRELLARVRVHLRLKGLRNEVEASLGVVERRARRRDARDQQRMRLVRDIAAAIPSSLGALHRAVAELRSGRPDKGSLGPRLDAIESSAATIAVLVGEMLETAWRDESQPRPKFCVFAPAGMLGVVFRKGARAAEQSGKYVSYVLAADLPLCMTDPDLFARSVDAILGHALSVTPVGGTVCVRVDAAGDRLHLEIEDGGAPLPAPFLDSLLAPRAAGHGRSPEPVARRIGVGFARLALERLGGTLTVLPRSDGRGTVYGLRLPSAATVEAEILEPV